MSQEPDTPVQILFSGRARTVNIKRVARGFTNFDNYRARILSRLGHTWQAPTTARLRGPNALTLAA